jgi:hypothetical protein
MTHLTRRQFFCALAAYAVAAGAQLPVGFPAELEPLPPGQYDVFFDGSNDYLTRGADLVGNADSKVFTLSLWAKLPKGTLL